MVLGGTHRIVRGSLVTADVLEAIPVGSPTLDPFSSGAVGALARWWHGTGTRSVPSWGLERRWRMRVALRAEPIDA